MLTLALYALLAVLVGLGLFLLAAHVLPAGEQIAPPLRDEPVWHLPAGHRLSAGDVAGVRLPVALRGYRFSETDVLLDRLAEELRARDEEIARLRGGLPASGAAEPPAPRPKPVASAPGESARPDRAKAAEPPGAAADEL